MMNKNPKTGSIGDSDSGAGSIAAMSTSRNSTRSKALKTSLKPPFPGTHRDQEDAELTDLMLAGKNAQLGVHQLRMCIAASVHKLSGWDLTC